MIDAIVTQSPLTPVSTRGEGGREREDARRTATQSPPLSRVARLAAFFRERPLVWIDGRELAKIGGAYAWRTRCSELRRPPWNLAIENRQRHVMPPDGPGFTVSEYRYRPSQEHPSPRVAETPAGDDLP